ncbi:MAG: hypothetical protein WA821_20940 [Anaerolineales bacterium]
MKVSCAFVALIFILVLTACGPQPAQPMPTVEAEPTLTASPTAAPAVATDSATETPESAISRIPTRPPLVTLAAGGPDAYRLAPQTADQADESIAQLGQIIPTLKNPYSCCDGDYYSPYYRAIWYAAWNALAHFPNDPRAEAWRWKMARYMALSGDLDEADQTYTELIESTLNADRVSVDDLPNHALLGNTQASVYEPSFVMEISPISVPHTDHGFIAKVGNLNNPDIPIAACFLVTEKAGQYDTYFIQDSFLDSGYNAMSRDGIDCLPNDLTNDGVDEIITNRYSGGHNGGFTFKVFDITSLPPQALPFTSKQGESSTAQYVDYVEGYPKINGKVQIQFNHSASNLNCDNYRNEYFQWTGKSFELVRQDFHFGLPPDVDLSANCVDDALGGLYELDTKDGASFLEQAVQAYRPYASQVGGILDEFIVRQAIYDALLGKQEKARATLTEMIRNPIIEDSVWIEPTQKFLATYKRPADLYLACSAFVSCTPYRDVESGPGTCTQIPLCDTEAVLDYTLTSLYPSIHLDQVGASLKKVGVDIAAEGWFDFDQDQKQEYWFTLLRPQNDEYGLWIVAESPKGKTILNAGFYTPNIPQPTFRIEHTVSHPFLINLDGYMRLELLRDPKTGEPSINWFDPDALDESQNAIRADLGKFKQLQQQLFSGGSPVPVYDQVAEIGRKYQDCPFKEVDKDGDVSYSYDCASFYYTLAFSAELAGNDTDAVKRYYAVWSVYPDSPFAILARLKLVK